MRSLACWTSEPKRASLSRRWTSSVSAALSSASEICVASARNALCSALRSAREVAVAPVTTSRPRASPRSVRPRTWAWACSGPRRRSSRISPVSTTPPRRLGQQLGGGVATQRPRPAVGLQGPLGGDDAEPAVLDQAQPRRGAIVEEGTHGLQRRAVDLRTAGGGHQRRARRAQRALARHRALLLADEARHAQHDEAEEHHRRRDDDEEVEVAAAQLLRGLDDRRDQRRHGQQRQSQRRQPRHAVGRGLLELAHRGVQGGGAPQQIEADPADVERRPGRGRCR